MKQLMTLTVLLIVGCSSNFHESFKRGWNEQKELRSPSITIYTKQLSHLKNIDEVHTYLAYTNVYAIPDASPNTGGSLYFNDRNISQADLV